MKTELKTQEPSAQEPKTQEPNAQDYFAGLYQRSDDPWLLRDRWYERRKRALTLAALPDEHYRRGYEPGCANGELTVELASRCETLLAADLNPAAVELARQRGAHLQNVRVEQRAMPDDWPDGEFDLIVISEVAYYLNEVQLAGLIARIGVSLAEGGTRWSQTMRASRWLSHWARVTCIACHACGCRACRVCAKSVPRRALTIVRGVGRVAAMDCLR